MQVIHPRCAGLDVHQKTVVATVMLTQDDGSVQKEQHTFLTMTPDPLALDDWLEKHQVTVVAMESTGDLSEAGVSYSGARTHHHPGQCSTQESGTRAQGAT